MTLPLLLLVLLSAAPGFSAEVVGIVDGDTLDVLANRQLIRVRLHGIDAPERRQPWSQRAKQEASRLAFAKTVTVVPMDRDRYGRLVARVVLPDGKDLSLEMVRGGMAWWFRRYAADDGELEIAETEAREARRGLWGDRNPVPPWQWRRHREQ